MDNTNNGLQRSALVMRILGWGTIAFVVLGGFLYPPGILWGSHPPFPHIGPAHPESPYEGFHPYVFMILALYLAWAILLIRGAKDPKANAALFDWGILANVLHASLMLVQAFVVPNEHAHLWADVPSLFIVSAVCWIWHPNRVAPGSS
ncbi:MAG TPA: DUF6632 domain-containing protein [Gemmataceae bacterium]|jgi:hypothetical protein|nr:DUF6632 domain-containing protein [Gemmataceae bacterium]